MSSQDPSYDPYSFAKVATRTASTEGGAAAACASNVRKFFQTVISMNSTKSGLNQINQGLNLCSDSQVESTADVGVLTNYVSYQWVSAVRCCGLTIHAMAYFQLQHWIHRMLKTAQHLQACVTNCRLRVAQHVQLCLQM